MMMMIQVVVWGPTLEKRGRQEATHTHTTLSLSCKQQGNKVYKKAMER